MAKNGIDTEREIQRLISTSTYHFDKEDFDEWMKLVTPDFRYSLTCYSSELRKDMTWLDLGHEELAGLFTTLPTHQRAEGDLLRHVNVCSVDIDEKKKVADVVSTVLVVFTDLNGQSKLFAAGRYFDKVSLKGEKPLFQERVMRLDTRVFMNDAGGSHVPM